MGPKDHPAGLLTLITVVKASAFIFHAYRCLRDNADDGRWRTMGDTASRERWFPTRQAPARLEPVLGANLSTTTKHVSSREALCTPASSPRIPQLNTFYSSKSWSIHEVKCTSNCQTCRGRYEPFNHLVKNAGRVPPPASFTELRVASADCSWNGM